MTLSDPPLAATAIEGADRIVVKIGSSLLVDPKTDAVDMVRLKDLAADIAEWKAEGKQVMVVSSGAVALGRRRHGARRGPRKETGFGRRRSVDADARLGVGLRRA